MGKIIQDIYVVKKSIRTVKKSDDHGSVYHEDKKEHEEPKHDIEHKVKIHKLHNEPKIEVDVNDEVYESVEYSDGISKTHVTKNSLMFLWTLCIISIATALFLLSSMFSTATLTITPKNEKIVLNDTYNITSDKSISSSTLHFEVMTLNKSLSKDLETDGEEYKEIKATGKAILYNNFSTVSQRLINNTRLETKDGLTYRLGESVEIPGMKKVSGVNTPGSIEVNIIADMPGDKYNMKLSDLKGDFTVPGFKGTSKYTNFYGRLSSDITGGFIGNVKKVSEEKLTAGRTELKNTLNADLLKEAFSKKPDQYVLFKDNYYIRCVDGDSTSANNSYTISENCSLNAVIFNKDILSVFIAKNKIKNFDNSKVDVMWGEDSSVALSGATEKPWTEGTIKAKFAGSAKVVWSYDRDTIVKSILGQDKSVIASVIENNKNYISEIQTTIRPMWNSTFPKNIKKIKTIDTVRDSSI